MIDWIYLALLFFISLSGIVLGTILNYTILKRLFKKQSEGILDTVFETPQAKEIGELIHRLNEYSHSPEAKELLQEIKTLMKSLSTETPKKPLIKLPEKKKER